MTLPDSSRLLSLPAATWRAFGERLHEIRFDADRTQALRQVASGSFAALRAPMVVWHARRQNDVIGYAVRMFMIEDPVTPAEAREVLGDVPVDALVDAGVLVRREGGVTSPFLFNIVGPHYVFCDHLRHGGDVVMGASSSTSILCHAGRPVRRVKRALDVGCGAGTAAILYSGHCDAVVATDVNPRAITMGKANALLNGLTNVEFREGDLFAPVAGETFDLVVSQPPFVARPAGVPETPYLFGGPRGGELALRLLEELPSHLAQGGRAVLLVEWPVLEDTIEQRIRKRVPEDAADLLLIQGPLLDLDEHCMSYAATRYPELGDEYRTMAMQWRDHFEEMNIRAVRMTLSVLEKSGRTPGLTSTVTLRRYGDVRITGARIDNMLAARELLAKGRDAILEAKLAIPAGTTFAQTPGEAGATSLVARPADDVGLEPTAINQGTYKLLVFVDRAARVREAAESVAAATKEPYETAATRVVAGVTQALECGLLELPSR